MRSRGINLDPTGRGRGRRRGRGRVGVKQVVAPKLVCATPYKILRNLINRLSRDLNLDSTTYTITKIKT
jgi:hypothetical protein